MKILLFSAQWPEYMIELANALAEKEKVWLMQAVNHRFTPKHRELVSKKVRFVPYRVIAHQSRRLGIPSALHILFILWRVRPDVLHIQANGGYPFLWVFRFMPRKTKVVNTIHDPVLHLGDEPSRRAYNQQVIDVAKKYTHRYIVHGSYLKQQLAQAYNVASNIISVIPHGHFEIYKAFRQLDTPIEDSDYVLFFGRVWPYKGLQYLIDAAEILIPENPELKFYIVGDGEPISNYRISPSYSKNIIVIQRYVPNSQVAHFFERCKCVVMPYIEATQSGVIPIATAFAKPTVATSVGSIPEAIIDGQTGFLVEARNSKMLARKIQLIVQDSSLATRMGEMAYNFAHHNLSWKHIAELTSETYRQA